MKKKKQVDSTATQRRKTLAEDVQKFLKAGNKIQYIDNGVSSQYSPASGRPQSAAAVNQQQVPAQNEETAPAAKEQADSKS